MRASSFELPLASLRMRAIPCLWNNRYGCLVLNSATAVSTSLAAALFVWLTSRVGTQSKGNQIPRQETYRLPKPSSLASVVQYRRGRRSLQAPVPPPNATESRPGYRQRVTKCINKYQLCTKNASSDQGVWRENSSFQRTMLNLPGQRDLRYILLQVT